MGIAEIGRREVLYLRKQPAPEGIDLRVVLVPDVVGEIIAPFDVEAVGREQGDKAALPPMRLTFAAGVAPVLAGLALAAAGKKTAW